jgi:hypothetical protein
MTINSSRPTPQVIVTRPLGAEISFATGQYCPSPNCKLEQRGLDIELLPRGVRHICRGCGQLFFSVIPTST